MKRLPVTLILSLIFLLSCEVEISEDQANTFIKFYGEYLIDTGFDVVKTDEGGYAIAGVSAIPDTVTAMAFYLTDKFGNPLAGYPKYYTDGRSCGANSVVKLNDGYLLCGYVVADAGGGETQRDIYLVRISDNGEEIWSNIYGGIENEDSRHAVAGNSGGFIIAGYREFDEEKDYWIFSVDEAGNFIREVSPQPIPDTDDDIANYLVNIPGQGYLCVCTYDEDTYDGTNVFVLSINNDMNTPYNLSLGTNYDDFGKCIINADGESFYVLGNTEDESSGKTEINVYKIEMDGLRFENSSLVATIQSGLEDLVAEKFVLSETGRLAIIGSSFANEDYNILLQFVDQEVPSERLYFGESGAQFGTGIISADDGGFVFVGANSFEGNSLISLVKTDSNGQL